MAVDETGFEHAGCPVCGGDAPSRELFVARDHLFGKPGRFRIVRCLGCGSLRVDPRPEGETLGRFYEDYYRPGTMQRAIDLQVGPRRGGFDPVRAGTEARWKEISRLLDQAGHGGHCLVVDAGAGLGGFTYHLSRIAGDVRTLGVEYSLPAVRYGVEELGVPMVPGSVEALPLRDGVASVVTMWHVLEHSPAPRTALAEAWRVLEPGGVLVVEVPAGDALLARLFGPHWFYLQPPTHLNLFSQAGLERLVTDAGFRISSVTRPYVPLELLGSLYYRVAKPSGLTSGPGKATSLIIGLAMLLMELPILTILRLLGASGVIRLLARKGPAQGD